jgi:hypothetical protein
VLVLPIVGLPLFHEEQGHVRACHEAGANRDGKLECAEGDFLKAEPVVARRYIPEREATSSVRVCEVGSAKDAHMDAALGNA